MWADCGLGWAMVILQGVALFHNVKGHPSMPTFAGPVTSQTIAKGRDATLKCVVDNLGDYRVAWVHVDKQTLLTIHTHVITRNKRISVSHYNYRTWLLHLKSVETEDSGYYMCQVNTQPMISQVGYLEIVVPPEFVNDVVNRNISRGWTTHHCRTEKSGSYDGEELVLHKVSRQSMGAYLCIASNGVPPAISRRMHIDITFPPMIWIPNQLVGASDGQTIALECNTEAHPAATNFWVRNDHVVGSSDDKFETYQVVNGYKVHMKIVIKNLEDSDFGIYRCVSKNALGETAGSVNLYKVRATSSYNKNIPPPSTPPEQGIIPYIPDQPEEEVPEKTGIQDNLSFQEEETEISVEQSTGTSSSSLSNLFPPKEQILAITLLLLVL
ncbi:Lachesin like protein [Argiope bruennichi]|uniref:Lachesin like protein n=1 Tax=Argiope bruennichi TaxID=94029 RepID=A0A8T0E001_ARGBR|nr:Lachesin like protein [Argiope bruennichi]